MTEIQELRGDIDDTLRELIALNRMDPYQRAPKEVRAIRQHSRWCLRELKKLHDKLDNLLEGAKSED